jgi:hypothetical protein
MTQRRGLSLIEALVTGLVIAATLPLLLQSGSTIVRMDKARQQRAQAANLARVALEGVHYDLYNGSSQGYEPADSAELRRAKYISESYLSPLRALSEVESGVVAGSARRVSRSFSRIFNRREPWSAGDPGVQAGIEERERPALAAELRDFRVSVEVIPHLDEPGTAGDVLARKEAEDPKVDLARLKVIVRWMGPQGGQQSRVFETRVTRPVTELDPTLSRAGR